MATIIGPSEIGLFNCADKKEICILRDPNGEIGEIFMTDITWLVVFP